MARPGLGALLALIFLLFFGVSTLYTGPAFLSDEMGYLSKSAALAGFPVDLATDWHGGYSLFLVPAFLIGSGPNQVWQIVMLVNATLWTLSFGLLFLILKEVVPELEEPKLILAVGLTALYPAWLSSSGYAIATGAFVLVYLLAGWTLLRACTRLHALAVGFLFWIHPTGLAVAVASVLVHLHRAWRQKLRLDLLWNCLLISTLVGFYKFWLHPWFQQVMSVQDLGSSGPINYPTATTLPGQLSSGEFWAHWPVMALGSVAYLLISSFGILLFGALEMLKRSRGGQQSGVAFLLLSQLGVILLSAVYLGLSSVGWPVQGPHSWFFGRYAESVALPLLAVGLLSPWPRKWCLIGTATVVFSGGLIELISTPANTSPYVTAINVQSFWAYPLLPNSSVAGWFGLSLLGILAVGLLQKRWCALIIVPLFAACLHLQADRHLQGIGWYSKPTAITDVVRTMFPVGTQIDMDPQLPEHFTLFQKERRNLYTFHLFDYGVVRSAPERWGQGPLLSYHPERGESRGLRIIAREKLSGLFLLVPKSKLETPREVSGQGIVLSEHWSEPMLRGCFEMSAQELAQKWVVGRFEGTKLVTTGRSGPMFMGPRARVQKGRYKLRMEADFVQPKGAQLKVLTSRRKLEFFKADLEDLVRPADDFLEVEFELWEDANDLEVQLWVKADTDIRVKGYQLTL